MTTSSKTCLRPERKCSTICTFAMVAFAAAFSPIHPLANNEAWQPVAPSASLQSSNDTVSEKSDIEFNIGATYLTPKSKSTLDSLALRINSLIKTDRLTKVEIIGSASIDGPDALNDRLARSRAKTVYNYLYRNPLTPLEGFSVSSRGENWPLLRSLVAEDTVLPGRDKALSIIDASGSPASKERRLRGMPATWRHLSASQFPQMRKADVNVYWLNSPMITESVTFESEPEPEVADTTLFSIPEIMSPEARGPTTYPTQPSPDTPDIRTRHYYIKTNLPAWLCLWTNIEAEADIAPHWSADLSVYYSGFNYFKRTLKFRTLSFMPEIRWWLSSDNDGFFAGAHFGLAYYNVALDGENRYQDHSGSTPALGGGITIGYRLPLRNPRWKLEFSAGAGIYHLDYDIFQNHTNGFLTGRRTRTFYGLDRAAVSLCYTFGRGSSEKKGGER